MIERILDLVHLADARGLLRLLVRERFADYALLLVVARGTADPTLEGLRNLLAFERYLKDLLS